MTEVRVNPQPVFDFEKALLANEATYKEGYKDLPNVRAVGNLWLYNTPTDRWPVISRKLDLLKQVERSLSSTDNPLPTIGWEVEIPRKPFQSPRYGMYALFFDFMGLPRNRNQTSVIPGNLSTYSPYGSFNWEFSTTPAYSAAVAKRTLCELIKGGFPLILMVMPQLQIDMTYLMINWFRCTLIWVFLRGYCKGMVKATLH